jgi:hypothetical protein
LVKLYADELARYRGDAAGATKLIGRLQGQPGGSPDDVAELAAWTVVANVLLNLDGVLTKG